MINGWFDRLARWRERRTLASRPIPDALWQLTLARYPFLAARPAVDVERLRELSTLFLADKEFTGAHDLQVTDEMAVAIAAQACLPILRLGLGWYDGFKGIVLHADAVVAPREVMDDDGVVHAYDEELSGEAMDGGPLMLSWQDVADAGNSAEWGYNVVIHEFAHVIDQRDGSGDTVPGLRERSTRDAWFADLQANYERFCDVVDAGADTVLDPYGAEALEEFFAVAAEAFFVAPSELQREHPRVYDLLAVFFAQDPLADSARQ